jgi:hypothetical protein
MPRFGIVPGLQCLFGSSRSCTPRDRAAQQDQGNWSKRATNGFTMLRTKPPLFSLMHVTFSRLRGDQSWAYQSAIRTFCLDSQRLQSINVCMQPWDRQTDETKHQYQCFCVFRDLGPARSIAKAIAAIGGRKAKAIRWRQWSTCHNWIARAEAYDRHVAYIEHRELERR